MRRLSLALILVFVATSLLAAEMPEMKPDPKLRQLDYLAGSFACTGTAFATPMGPEHPTQATVSAGWQLNDYWLAFTYAESMTDKNPMPFTVSGYMGYDMEQKKLVVGTVDAMGGYSTSVSDGWKDNVLTYEGPWHMGPATVKGKDTFTKKSADEFVHAAWIEQGGKWIKLDEETCSRSM
jgi:uncharacterized protein DUF1579